ncbi:MAG TPA: PA0069 family radical SAM protein [Stellaceae bacterium]|nr:PA0069 family radical SAM protein [Stellaceae bacterium]
MDDEIPLQPRKGRGAISQPMPRFDAEARVLTDDGWHQDDPAPLDTTVTVDATKSIIARNKSPDVPFDQSINPYRGCEHGCVYCFARPSHAYLGLSPGLDFETRLFAKPDAAKLLRQELARPSYRCSAIAMGTNTDPYQPIERQWRITRSILEVLSECDHPVSIVTKSALVTRDIDILAPMAEKGLAAVALSVTTLDRDLARRMEPRASTPGRRLDAIAALSEAGIPVTVMAAPIVPALTDMELEAILEAARDKGASRAGYVLLRLPHEVKDLFAEWLDTHAPMRARHVLSLVRDMRHGDLNVSQWGERMRGDGPYADLIAHRFHLAVKRLQLDGGRRFSGLVTTRFRKPGKPAPASDQFSLF